MKNTLESLKNSASTFVRIALATAVMSFSMAAYISSIANAAILKAEVVIDAEHITLGDIFEGLENNKNTNYILGPAPQPGKDIIINAHSLRKLSRAFRLDWQPQSNFEQVVVSRSATIVTADEIKDAVSTALYEQGYDKNYRVDVSSMLQDIILPGQSSGIPEVERVSVDNRNHFRATVALPSDTQNKHRINVMGSLQYMVEVPVLARRIDRDEVIRAADLEIVLIPQERITADMIVRQDELVGKAPRRHMAPGQVAKLSDVVLPKIVRRGARVNMVLNHNGMELTTLGRAMEDGAKGDVIRVINLASNRIIDSHVATEGVVHVYP